QSLGVFIKILNLAVLLPPFLQVDGLPLGDAVKSIGEPTLLRLAAPSGRILLGLAVLRIGGYPDHLAALKMNHGAAAVAGLKGSVHLDAAGADAEHLAFELRGHTPALPVADHNDLVADLDLAKDILHRTQVSGDRANPHDRDVAT